MKRNKLMVRTGLRAALAAVVIISAPAHATSHVFLVQNSGWMEPFFTDPASPYKALITEVLLASTAPKDMVLLASFNQSLPDAPSPKKLAVFQVPETATVRQQVTDALAPLSVARKPRSQALADTDLNEAVSASIKQGLGGRPGLIWLFTNNKNSPNNDQATAQRNREFYQLIHQGSDITAALAFPLKMPLQGKQYHANGMMVYVFASQPEGAKQLQALLARGSLQKVLTEPAARLKPLDQDSVQLQAQRVLDAPGVRFSTDAKGVLWADVAPGASQPQAKVQWLLHNRMHPYTIDSASVSAQSRLGRENREVLLDHAQIKYLTPNSPQPLQTVLQLPLAQLPGKWSLAAIGKAGSAYIVPGQLELHLSQQKLSLAEPFKQRMADLFPGDPLPDIFTPPATIQQSSAILPLQVRVEYGVAPLLAALGAAASMALAALGAYVQMGRLRKVAYRLDGVDKFVQGRRGERCVIRNLQGDPVAECQIGWFQHQLLNIRDGVNITLI